VSVPAAGDGVEIASADAVFEALDPVGADRCYFRVLDTALVFSRGSDSAITSIAWGPGAFTLLRER
jgi:hypothetical protein